MRQISKLFIIITFISPLLFSSDLREYSQPLLIFKRQAKQIETTLVEQISFSYAEESKNIYIYDRESANSTDFSLNILAKQDNTYNQINKTLITQLSTPIKKWSTSRNGDKYLWVTYDGNLFMKGIQNYQTVSYDVSLFPNNTLNFLFSSDGKRVLLRYQKKHSHDHIPTYIFSLQQLSIQPIVFQNSNEAIAIGLMNQDNAFIVIQQQPKDANDDRNYQIKQLRFNNVMNFYLEETAERSLVGKFDYAHNDMVLRIGQDDDFMLFYSGNQAVILKKENENWVTKDRKVFSQYKAGIQSSQNGVYLLIKSQNKYPILYKVSKDLYKFQKLAIIDSPIDPITNYYVTNEGDIFISNGNDLYFLKQILSENQTSSTQTSIDTSAQGQIVVGQNDPFSSIQVDNSLQILGFILLLCTISLIVVCLLCRCVKYSKQQRESEQNRIIQQQSMHLQSSSLHQRRNQSVQIALQS